MNEERLLIAVDDAGSVHLLAVKGLAIESEIDDLGRCPDDLGLDDVSQTPGLHVFTCRPQWRGEGPDGSMEYHHGMLRSLTGKEWAFVQAGDFEGLKASWTDVETLDEPAPAERVLLAQRGLGA